MEICTCCCRSTMISVICQFHSNEVISMQHFLKAKMWDLFGYTALTEQARSPDCWVLLPQFAGQCPPCTIFIKSKRENIQVLHRILQGCISTRWATTHFKMIYWFFSFCHLIDIVSGDLSDRYWGIYLYPYWLTCQQIESSKVILLVSTTVLFVFENFRTQ